MAASHPPSTITFDDSLWPLLVVRMTGTPTPQQFEDYLAARGAYLDRRQKHVLLYDAARFNVLSNEQRQRQVEWLREHEVRRREFTLGSALVLVSPLARLTFSLVRHFSPTKTPYVLAPSLNEAARWAATCLDEAGLQADAHRIREHFGLGVNLGTG